jgi:tetratricopeptide (TPR) repeat protein
VWKFVITIVAVFIILTSNSLKQKKTQPPKIPAKPETQASAPFLPIKINNETTKTISTGKWREAGRKVFLEAIETNPSGADTVVYEQALSGYLDDALLTLPSLRPHSQSWILFKAAHELETLEPERRISMFRQAAEVVRAKKMPAIIRSDALTHAAIGLLEQNKKDEAIPIMFEALQSALAEPNEEERGAALRVLADDLEAASWIDVSLLLPIAEQAAKFSNDPFHNAFAHASLARIWYRLGDKERAWRWWNEGLTKVEKISRLNSKATAEMGLAEVSAEMGNRELADDMIANQRGTFVDVLVEKVMIIEAKKKNYAEALRYFSSIRNGCASSIAVGGFSLRAVVEIQVKNTNIDEALKTLSQLSNCAPRFVGEAWLDVAEAQIKLKDRTAVYQSVQKAISPIKAITTRPKDKFELLALVRAGEIMARNGQKAEGITQVMEAVTGILKLRPNRTEEKVTVTVEAGKVLAKYGSGEKAINAIMEAYQLATNFPKEGLFPEMDKARSLAEIGKAMSKLN